MNENEKIENRPETVAAGRKKPFSSLSIRAQKARVESYLERQKTLSRIDLETISEYPIQDSGERSIEIILSAREARAVQESCDDAGISRDEYMRRCLTGAELSKTRREFEDPIFQKRCQAMLDVLDDMAMEPSRRTKEWFDFHGLPETPPDWIDEKNLTGNSPWISMRRDGISTGLPNNRVGQRAYAFIERAWAFLDLVMEDWPGWLDWEAQPLSIEDGGFGGIPGGRGIARTPSLQEDSGVFRRFSFKFPNRFAPFLRLRALRSGLSLGEFARRKALGLKCKEMPERCAHAMLGSSRSCLMIFLQSCVQNDDSSDTLDQALNLLEEMDEAQAQLLEMMAVIDPFPVKVPSVVTEAMGASRGWKAKSFDVWCSELEALERGGSDDR